MNEEIKSSVLVVDDNTNNLHVLADILRSGDLKVATAKDGSRALKFIEKKKPDLILLDIMMPEMDGYEICDVLKKNADTRDIPIIFISALDQPEDKLKGFQCGGVDYITKPFRREEVFARVNVHLTLKQAREKLKAANEELKIANATRDKLFSIIAHDLRGPVSSLAGILEIIETQPEFLEKKNRASFFGELGASAKNLFHLIENLLSWAKNQRNIIRYRPESILINNLVESNIELFSAAAKEKGIDLRSEMEDRLVAYADVDMIMTVIRNLVSNAIKFTPENGNIRVGAALGEGCVKVTVSDDGVGVSCENMRKLFQIREHYSTYGTRNEKGSGLGLLLCKEFVEKNGGKIWAESELSQGSRFTFTLPISAESCGKIGSDGNEEKGSLDN